MKKKEFFLVRWFKRLFFGAHKEVDNLTEEQLETPLRVILRNFREKKSAMFGLIAFLLILIFVLVGPLIWKIDLSYADSTLTNLAPSQSLLKLPKDLKNNGVADIGCGKTFGVGIDEEDIGEIFRRDSLHGYHHSIRYLLHGDEKGIRLGLGRSGGETALAAAKLHLHGCCLGVQLPPMAPHGLRLADPAALAGVHARVQILLFSHTHLGILPALAPAARGDFCDIIPQNTAPCKRIISFSPEKTGGNGRRWRNDLKSVQRLPLCFVRYVKFKKDGRETLDKN